LLASVDFKAYSSISSSSDESSSDDEPTLSEEATIIRDNVTAEAALKTVNNLEKPLSKKGTPPKINDDVILDIVPIIEIYSKGWIFIWTTWKVLDKWFENRTAWKIEVVPGLIPVDDFFELLAQKKFCSSTWLRKMEQLDYLEEPDMFHDIFGHIPLLSNALFSDFMQKFGKLGVAAKGDDEQILKLQRLYWFTIEFGMIGSDDPKIYGAGICSSFGETNRSINKTISKVQYEKFLSVLKRVA
jgi:hypothetical protein